METENLWFDLEGERGEKIKKINKNLKSTKLKNTGREIWRAFGLK